MSDEMSDEDRKKLFSHLGNMFMDAMSGKFDPKKGGVRVKRIDENGSAELEYVPPLPKDPD
jgi:hypothetical protein